MNGTNWTQWVIKIERRQTQSCQGNAGEGSWEEVIGKGRSVYAQHKLHTCPNFSKNKLRTCLSKGKFSTAESWLRIRRKPLAGMFKMLLGVRAVNSVHSSLSRPMLHQAWPWYWGRDCRNTLTCGAWALGSRVSVCTALVALSAFPSACLVLKLPATQEIEGMPPSGRCLDNLNLICSTHVRRQVWHAPAILVLHRQEQEDPWGLPTTHPT